jgi:two-component system nitrogen regulation sensor histidine kinase GlnL
MGRDKNSSISFTIDDGLKLKSWSGEFEKIWGGKTPKIENCFFHEILPVNNATVNSVKRVLKDGKPVRLKEVKLSCPYGFCAIDMNIAPLDRKNLSNGVKISLAPAFICQKELQASDSVPMEEISSTVATIAHGVRNPLNAIKGAVVYIREKYPKEKNLNVFTRIMEEEIDRLDAFIAHYLSTAIEQKRIATVDINSVLRKIEILMSFQVQSHNIQPVYHFGSIPHVKINPFLIEQAFLNVINNAIEAMAQGGKLTITTEPVNRSKKQYVLVEIADTGSGIMKSISQTLSSHRKGRGFGLLITREIIKSVSGHLEITSKRGIGTVVRLFFPCG